MPPRRTLLHLSVERDLPGDDPDRPTRVRLSADLEPPADGRALPSEELAAAIRELRAELDAAVGPGGAPRPDRSLPELVQTYRPRQAELIELLHDEGELSDGEHAALREYLAAGGSGGPALPGSPAFERASDVGTSPLVRGDATAATIPAPAERPLAAAPLAHESAPGVARSIPELLSKFQIATLKQAGAVRARRQISFEEYMALKRHFEASARPGPSDPSPV